MRPRPRTAQLRGLRVVQLGLLAALGALAPLLLGGGSDHVAVAPAASSGDLPTPLAPLTVPCPRPADRPTMGFDGDREGSPDELLTAASDELLVAASDQRIVVTDESGATLRTLAPTTRGDLSSIAVRPGSSIDNLAVAYTVDTSDGTEVRILDEETDTRRATVSDSVTRPSVAWSRDGSHLATITDVDPPLASADVRLSQWAAGVPATSPPTAEVEWTVAGLPEFDADAAAELLGVHAADVDTGNPPSVGVRVSTRASIAGFTIGIPCEGRAPGEPEPVDPNGPPIFLSSYRKASPHSSIITGDGRGDLTLFRNGIGALALPDGLLSEGTVAEVDVLSLLDASIVWNRQTQKAWRVGDDGIVEAFPMAVIDLDVVR